MRLTKKTDTKERTTIGMPKAVACYWKLKKYEDIEEELGIDLIILFKAMKKGIYTKKGYSPTMRTELCFGNYPPFIYSDCDNDGYLLSDYGKTWALTEEELEK